VLDVRGVELHNNLVIRATPGADGAIRPFAEDGDSGALIIDARRRRAIGLLWGVNLVDPREAYACHIHPVLDCLGLTPYRFALTPPSRTALARRQP
jgi:hypothetical protein